MKAMSLTHCGRRRSSQSSRRFFAVKTGFSGLSRSQIFSPFSLPPVATLCRCTGFCRILHTFLPASSSVTGSLRSSLQTRTVPHSPQVTRAESPSVASPVKQPSAGSPQRRVSVKAPFSVLKVFTVPSTEPTSNSVSAGSPQHRARTSWSRLRWLVLQKLKACFWDRLTPFRIPVSEPSHTGHRRLRSPIMKENTILT